MTQIDSHLSPHPVNTNGKRLFIARHGETVFNLAGRIQGNSAHTPLTRLGFAQADEMGRALAHFLGAQGEFGYEGPPIDLMASAAGRALQTLSVVCEHIGLDWHQAEADPRLNEIGLGEWEGLYYSTLSDKLQIDSERSLFLNKAPGGEDYRDIAIRLSDWIAAQSFDRDMILISHGMTSRVLRGVLRGLPQQSDMGAPIAESLPQGSMVQITDGVETIIHRGGGESEKA